MSPQVDATLMSPATCVTAAAGLLEEEDGAGAQVEDSDQDEDEDQEEDEDHAVDDASGAAAAFRAAAVGRTLHLFWFFARFIFAGLASSASARRCAIRRCEPRWARLAGGLSKESDASTFTIRREPRTKAERVRRGVMAAGRSFDTENECGAVGSETRRPG